MCGSFVGEHRVEGWGPALMGVRVCVCMSEMWWFNFKHNFRESPVRGH